MVGATPLAAIDVGSNTVHLTVARVTVATDDLDYLADELDLVRLGADISATGAIGPERAELAVAAIRKQMALAHRLGATTVLGIATEGVRAARNGAEFLAQVREQTGLMLELVTGEQEAALTYWGATSGLHASDAAVAAPAPRRAVLDLGGGSLELVVGEGQHVLWRVSLPLGSGAVHGRYAPADPPRAAELGTVRAVVTETLAALDPPPPVVEAIACGGTATTLAVLDEGARAENIQAPQTDANLDTPGRAMRHERRLLTHDSLAALLALLQSQPAAQIATRYDIEEPRARLLGAGGMVLLATMDRLGVAALRVRRRGIREGAMLAYVHAGEGWLALAQDGAGWPL